MFSSRDMLAVGDGLVACLVIERDGGWVWGCGRREKWLFWEVVRSGMVCWVEIGKTRSFVGRVQR